MFMEPGAMRVRASYSSPSVTHKVKGIQQQWDHLQTALMLPPASRPPPESLSSYADDPDRLVRPVREEERLMVPEPSP
ncbi:hypothetical protein EYF80_046125 [Liparis tanakae]|uniref:Uncharacterized protein n=1 Tax=Liparis tanakae TaxID=230148 RepID=A0A4Z2FTH4_9TELE|nr:hypothetical protein EYF80_046125 [Liparis tanakae]